MSPDLHHLSGAYAVDALDDAERASFEQHLAGCADCRAEVAELSATAGSLASLTETTPPPSLRDSVLSGIAQVRPLPPPTRMSRRRPTTKSRMPAAPSCRSVAAPHRLVRRCRGRRRDRHRWPGAWSPWSDDPAAQSPMVAGDRRCRRDAVSTTKDGMTAEVAYSQQLGKAAIDGHGHAARTRRQDLPALVRGAGPGGHARPGCSTPMPRGGRALLLRATRTPPRPWR